MNLGRAGKTNWYDKGTKKGLSELGGLAKPFLLFTSFICRGLVVVGRVG